MIMIGVEKDIEVIAFVVVVLRFANGYLKRSIVVIALIVVNFLRKNIKSIILRK